MEDGTIEQNFVRLITNLTYETVVLVGGVADFPYFIGHVVVDFRIVGDELEPTRVDDVLVLSVVVVFHWRRFDRVQRIEKVGERHYNRFLRICSLL